MKKSTPKVFSKLIAQYGALTTAILGISKVNGDIVHTDVDPDGGGFQTFYYLDLDNNSQADFIIDHNMPFLKFFPVKYYVGSGNAVSAKYNYPNVGLFDDVISSGNPSWKSNYANMFLNAKSCTFSYPQWCDVTDGYLKLRFLIGTETHYGWARLDVANNAGYTGNWVIKDYAYNDVPNAPINAGQTTLGIEDSLLSAIKIVSSYKNIKLYNLPDHTHYQVYSLTGQSVLRGNISGQSHTINANTISTGIYFIELKDVETNAVLRKKIVL